ncbi:dynamin family protein [Yoonia maritima]|uniref:dynamin family protein n=1 Tax=Yoonia maritima TaxID=1435347 RepID=UPI0037350892
MTDTTPASGGPRKPRIALMGEFSAGKSTLSNLLMGARPLPEKVTATRLSPVWMSHGTHAPFRVDVDGSTEPVSLDRLEDIPVEETMCIRLFLECDILDVCDLIDFPGISDPNMSSDVWERMLPEVDAVIWLTHATQAWRQSEAAVWDTMPNAVRENSILLITRFDKLTTEKDRLRVFKRVRRETDGQFAATFPISLLQALEAGEDFERWDASGAGPFVEHLIQAVEKLSKLAARSELPLYNIADGTAIPEPVAAAVLPRRVKRPLNADSPKRERPTAEQAQAAEIPSKPGAPTS